MLAMIDVFNWEESEAFNLGYAALFESVITKLLVEKLVSTEKFFINAPSYWKRFMRAGKMKSLAYDPIKKTGVLMLEEFPKYHPLIEEYIRGSITRFIEATTKSKNVKVLLSKSIFKNDPYDEFKITWD